MERVKYLLFFVAALISAIATYKTFFMFQGETVFSVPMTFVNTVVILLIWGFSFSAKNDFVRGNAVNLVFIPLLAVHFSNLITHLNNPMTDSTGFILYVVASTSLVAFSYQSSVIEKQLD